MTASFRQIRGFTLIELLTVMALVAILMMLAGPGMRQLLVNQKLSAAASDLQTTAMQARSTALKDNQRVVVRPFCHPNKPADLPACASPPGWSDGWQVFVDANQDSTFAGSDTLVLTQEWLPAEVTIAKVTGTNNYFGYEGSGFLASIGGSSNATWMVSSTGTDRKKYVVIERSGRAYVCDPKLVTNCPPP
ncbi:MAG: GspH/FimT family pseudopilin [Rhodoferax sp.]|nr:GspH/FimT family pseudopilin [Rhodoferax sp.]